MKEKKLKMFNVLVLFFLSINVYPGIAQEKSNQFFIFSIHDESTRTVFRVLKNGTNISYRNILIMNYLDVPLVFNSWISGTIFPNNFSMFTYEQDQRTQTFELKIGNNTILFGILNFVSRIFDDDIDNTIKFDFGRNVPNWYLEIISIITFGLVSLPISGYFARQAKRRKPEKIKYL